MLNIALTILGIVLFNTLISLVGSAAITSFLYSVIFGYILPNDLHRKQRALKGEILKGRTELSNTSAQDDFSKWAKIRRRVDKQGVELEAMNSSLASHRSSFEKVVKAVVFLGTTGLQFAYTSRHSKTAIVYLPEGWFGSLGWFLGLPFAPKGAISTTVFIFLIKRVLGVLTRVGKDIVQGARGKTIESPPVAVPVSASTKAGPQTAGAAGPQQRKKDL